MSVVGNCLFITIPEKWLAEAAYPVIVDPTVGTTSIGSQTHWVKYAGEDPEILLFDCEIPVNRFLVSETINDFCTAYFYTNEDDIDAGGRPVLFSDNGNKPQTRKSMNEAYVDLRVTNSKTKGWRSASFNSNGSIASGSYIWFGLFCEYIWCPRFDYGVKCYAHPWHDDVIPANYPLYDSNDYSDFKLSMYFQYTSAQNYVQTLTQGVKLSDNRKLAGNYKRTVTQTARVNSSLKRFETFIRKCVMTVKNTMMINRLPLFFRNATEQIKITMSKNEKLSLSRKCADDVKINSDIKRYQNVIRLIKDGLKILDTQSFSVLFVRPVHDTATAAGYFSRLGAFIRGLPVTADSNACTAHNAEYYRFNSDTVQAEGKANRGLLLFIRIITGVFIRDYLLRRFLIAKEEIILKSCITRELSLESKIN